MLASLGIVDRGIGKVKTGGVIRESEGKCRDVLSDFHRAAKLDHLTFLPATLPDFLKGLFNRVLRTVQKTLTETSAALG